MNDIKKETVGMCVPGKNITINRFEINNFPNNNLLQSEMQKLGIRLLFETLHGITEDSKSNNKIEDKVSDRFSEDIKISKKPNNCHISQKNHVQYEVIYENDILYNILLKHYNSINDKKHIALKRKSVEKYINNEKLTKNHTIFKDNNNLYFKVIDTYYKDDYILFRAEPN